MVLTRVFYSLAQGTRLMDTPNERSMHIKPVVRGGGVIFIGLSLCSIPVLSWLTLTSASSAIVLFSALFGIAVISFCDDIYNLSAKKRFIVQILVSILIAIYFKPPYLDLAFFKIDNNYLLIPFLIIALLWSINHTNFMDGIDAFCAIQAISVLSMYVFIMNFLASDSFFLQQFCMVIILSLLGFLVFNYPPARLFMGDVGSASLGMILFSIAIICQQQLEIPLAYWFLVNGIFIFDATLTLIRRILNGEKWYTGHRKHAYQRLKQSGLTTQSILLGQIFINSFFTFLMLLILKGKLNLNHAIFIETGVLGLIYLGAEKKFPMFIKAQ